MTQDELVGVVLLVGSDEGVGRPLRIDNVLGDPTDPAGEIMLYELSAPNPRTGTGRTSASPTRMAAEWAFR